MPCCIFIRKSKLYHFEIIQLYICQRRLFSIHSTKNYGPPLLYMYICHLYRYTYTYVCMCVYMCVYIYIQKGIPGGSVVKNPPANAEDTGDAGDTGSIPGSERCCGESNGYPL